MKKKNIGFTVLELLIVVAIIAFVGIMFLTAYLDATAQSKTSVSNRITTMTLILEGSHVPAGGSEQGSVLVFVNNPVNPTPGPTPPANMTLNVGSARGVTFSVSPSNAGTIGTNGSGVTGQTGIMSFTVYAGQDYTGPITITATDSSSGETISLNSNVK